MRLNHLLLRMAVVEVAEMMMMDQLELKTTGSDQKKKKGLP